MNASTESPSILAMTDKQTLYRTLLDAQERSRTLQQRVQASGEPLTSPLSRSALQVELRLNFLLLHFCPNQLTSLDWIRLESRNRSLRRLLGG